MEAIKTVNNGIHVISRFNYFVVAWNEVMGHTYRVVEVHPYNELTSQNFVEHDHYVQISKKVKEKFNAKTGFYNKKLAYVIGDYIFVIQKTGA
ncbi:MAG: hypothetical protein KatS3mg083_290 [Candidatus Dojkabacteria bacterium]|nr:MAG: hypothetical protein KatS3mg083_290 [Candidatus Dojkabacteria bacterium]